MVTRSAKLIFDHIVEVRRQFNASMNIVGIVETFRLLLILGNQIKSCTQGCCQDAWIQAAMTLTNVVEHVSSIEFNLELCRVVFDKEYGANESLTLVVEINSVEVEIVKNKASVDVETLLVKVTLELNSLKGRERDLGGYLLQRLLRIQVKLSSFPSTSALLDVNDEEFGFWRRLLQWIQPTEQLGKGAAAIVYKATWLGIQVAKKTFEGHQNPDSI